MQHTTHYNGMVWQVRGPLAERGDDFASRPQADCIACHYNKRAAFLAAHPLAGTASERAFLGLPTRASAIDTPTAGA